ADQPDLGLPVAVAGSSVYCVTNLGAVAALETSTGSIRWIRIYDRVNSTGNDQFGLKVAASTDFWGPNPPIVSDDCLIVTPQDSDLMYGLDTQTGARQWQVKRTDETGLATTGESEQLKHVLGIVNGRVVLSGRNILFVKVKGGRSEGVGRVPPGQTIVGRGLIAQERVFVPTDKALLLFDASL